MILTYLCGWLIVNLIPMKKKYSLILIAFLCFVASGYGQVTIGIQDFETSPAAPTMTYTGGSIATGVGPYPVGDNNFVSGSRAIEVNNGTETVLFSSVNTTGYTNVYFTCRLASFAGSSGNGADGTDEVYFEISDDNGATWSQEIEVQGNANAKWSFDTGTGSASTTYDGDNLATVFTPAGGGYRTTDGYSTITITDLPNVANLRVRLVMNNNSGNEYWIVDDAEIIGTPAATSDLAISGTTDHGSSCLGVAASTVQYTITNNSAITTAIDVSAVSDNTQFVVSNLSSTTIIPSGTATFDVTFTPTATGNQNATITVASTTITDDATILLSGTGITTPTISAQPTNQTEQIPNTATFSVTSGDASTYQWQVSTNGGTNWNPIGGANATSYTTGATDATMDGNLYRCVLTNACGNTISNSASLTLTNPSPNNVTSTRGCFEDNSVNIDWVAPASGPTPTGYVVFMIDGGTAPAGALANANTYTADANFTTAATVSATLGKVVYKGNATSATVTNLTEDNNYSITVFAYVGETLTGWSNGTSGGSRVVNGLAQADVRNLVATPLTNQINLNWNNPTPSSCWDQLIIVANQGTVTFTPTGDGSAYTGADNDVYSTPNQLVYETTSSVTSKSVTGFTNGTSYCLKVFIRRGTTWSEGVEVCAVPSLTYCNSYGDGSDGFFTLINNVEFNTINNASPTTVDNDYSDFTAISTTVTLGETYNLDVRVETDGAYTTTTRAWIDWNNDGDFSDSNEVYELGNAYNVIDGSTDASPLAIEVPTNAVVAATRMRVSTRFGTTAPTPCQQNFDGEVEDYTINIVRPANAEINITGNNISIPNGFNSPYGLNNTLFAATNIGATTAPKSYYVQNIGLATLNLTGAPRVQLTGAHPGDFNVTLQPSATVGSTATSEFRIEFSPTADGVRTATVSISNSDSDENPYTFDIEGTGQCTATITSSIWPSEGPENTEVTITSATDLTGASASINGVAMTTVSSTATELVVLVPAGSTSGNISVLFSIGCSSTNAFTVIDNVISGCDTASSSTVPTDLFISEISDATSGSSSLVEIFNGTAASIDLSDYSIRVFNNGNASPSSTLNLSGTLVSGGVHVISIGTTSCDLTGNGLAGGLPDQTFNAASGINFNNNSSDALELYNSTTSTSIDVFGVLGSSSWANGLSIGDDGVNYRRQNTAANLPSTTFDISEWDEIDWTDCNDSDYSDFGIYDFSLGVPPTVSVLSAPTFNCTSAIQLSVTGTEGVSGGSPLAYQWYYLVPNASTFVVVPDNADFDNVTTATLDIVNPIGYGDYQFYCQVRENTATCYQASNAVKLDIISTVWDGTNWSSVPAINKVAVIDADYDTSNGGVEISFEACECIVNTGYTLTIENNTYVRVENDLTVDGNIVVKTDGAFVQVNDNASILGDVLTTRNKISVEKETAPLASYREYTYWSTPVVGETISDGLFEADANRIFSFSGENFRDSTAETNNNNATANGQDDIDDDANDWQPVTGATTMITGVGYAATHNPIGFVPTRYIYIFEGPFNNGVYNIPIYRNDNELNDNNWNFIGNPYPSAIAIDGPSGFLAQNASTIDNNVPGGAINGAIFLWSHDTAADGNTNGNENLNYSQSDYAIINGSGQTAGGDNVMPNRFIPSGQGFFVSMDNGATATPVGGNIHTTNVVFNNSMRVTGDNDQFFRNSITDQPNKLWLDLTSDNGIFNQILVAYVDGATDGDDGAYYDAHKNLSSELYSGIYSLINNSNDKKFAIQGKNPNSLNIDEIIPVGFSTIIDEPTIYTISIRQLEGAFMLENDIYIIDHMLNSIHNLKVSDYNFTSEAGEFNERFEIVFRADALSIDDETIDTNQLTIIELANGDVKIKVSSHLTIVNVEILDVLGRQVYNLEGNSSEEVYNLSKLSNAAYIANVTLSNGQTISKKAIKQR